MINNEKLSFIDLKPTVKAEKCIIWLHGLGADGNDFVPIAKELNLPQQLQIRFIFPHAPVMPVTINSGYEMRAWFDIRHPDINSHVDRAGIEQSISSISNLIQQVAKEGIQPENIMLAGFSQGAVIAAMTGLIYPERLAGVIALSGLLPHAEDIMKLASPANHSLPIFIGHGTQDQIVPAALGSAAERSLKQAGYNVEYHTYPMAHSVCMEEIEDISNWIQKIW